MRTRQRTYVYPIYDSWPDLAIVRCPDGDRDAFYRLVAEYWRLEGTDPEPVAEPQWRWCRWNPDRHYGLVLDRPKGPGRGNWMGAMVRVDRGGGGA